MSRSPDAVPLNKPAPPLIIPASSSPNNPIIAVVKKPAPPLPQPPTGGSSRRPTRRSLEPVAEERSVESTSTAWAYSSVAKPQTKSSALVSMIRSKFAAVRMSAAMQPHPNRAKPQSSLHVGTSNNLRPASAKRSSTKPKFSSSSRRSNSAGNTLPRYVCSKCFCVQSTLLLSIYSSLYEFIIADSFKRLCQFHTGRQEYTYHVACSVLHQSPKAHRSQHLRIRAFLQKGHWPPFRRKKRRSTKTKALQALSTVFGDAYFRVLPVTGDVRAT